MQFAKRSALTMTQQQQHHHTAFDLQRTWHSLQQPAVVLHEAHCAQQKCPKTCQTLGIHCWNTSPPQDLPLPPASVKQSMCLLPRQCNVKECSSNTCGTVSGQQHAQICSNVSCTWQPELPAVAHTICHQQTRYSAAKPHSSCHL